MHEDAALADLCRMIEEVVGVEGPAHQDLVLGRIREAWGVQRAGVRIRKAFDAAIRSLCRRASLVRDKAGFLSINDHLLETVRSATEDPKSCRDVQEIPTAELGLAMDMLVRDARSITWDELTTRVARLFGWNRRGPDIGKALDTVLQARIRGGAVIADGEMLKPGTPQA